jgi:peroxiredoxin
MARPDDLHQLPAGLPVPVDDGACAHLLGMAVPALSLPSTAGGAVDLAAATQALTVIYAYPRTGVPDREAPGGNAAWDLIPGARGCTPQSCAYRDHHAELVRAHAQVFGLSTQTPDYQAEMAGRLHLPFAVLSDADLRLTRALRLPTFFVEGMELLKRLTLLCEGGRVVHVRYPVFPSDQDAAEVMRWLAAR